MASNQLSISNGADGEAFQSKLADEVSGEAGSEGIQDEKDGRKARTLLGPSAWLGKYLEAEENR